MLNLLLPTAAMKAFTADVGRKEWGLLKSGSIARGGSGDQRRSPARRGFALPDNAKSGSTS